MSYQPSNLFTLGLSLATPPLVLGIVVVSALLDKLVELGQQSEEVFRGDRLPLLNWPQLPDETRAEDDPRKI